MDRKQLIKYFARKKRYREIFYCLAKLGGVGTTGDIIRCIVDRRFAKERNPYIEWNSTFRSRLKTLEKHGILHSTKTDGKRVWWIQEKDLDYVRKLLKI